MMGVVSAKVIVGSVTIGTVTTGIVIVGIAISGSSVIHGSLGSKEESSSYGQGGTVDMTVVGVEGMVHIRETSERRDNLLRKGHDGNHDIS